MGAPKMLVAKYVPDLHRMEPRNIGIIVWMEGHVKTRFLGVSDDGRVLRVPTVAKDDSHAYREWIAAWTMMAARSSIDDPSTGREAVRTDPQFVDILVTKSKPQFMLTDGVEYFGKVRVRELKEFTDEMFVQLVERETPLEKEQAASDLKRACQKAIAGSRLESDDVRRPRTNLLGDLFGIHKYFDADYAFGVDPRRTTVFQRVVPGKGSSANLATVLFQGLQKKVEGQPEYKCCTLYLNGKPQGSSAETDLAILKRLSDLIDVSNEADARRKMEHVVGLNGEP